MRPSGLLQQCAELLLKHRTLVIGLILVSLGGVALLIHLGVILDTKKPPRPSPAPSPGIQVEINSSSKPRVTSAPEPGVVSPPSPEPSRVYSRPKAVRLDNFPVGRTANSREKAVPVIIERRSSAVVITQVPQAKQGAGSGTPIQAEQHRTEPPRKERVIEPADAMPFFAPPVPPEGGINALIASTLQSDMKQALAGYIRTYYPLVALDAASINQLNPQGKAEYERQKAAFDKELSDVLSDSISPTPGGIDSGYPQELLDMLKKGGEGN